MSLAQVVHKISSDTDFAAQWRKDPKAALVGNGFDLSQEEIAFLSKGLGRAGYDNGQKVPLSSVDPYGISWRE